jgi:hypothetical protein
MALSEIKMTMSLATAGVTTALDKAKTGIASFTSTALDKLGKVASLASGALLAGFIAASKGALDYAKNLDTLAQVSNTTSEDFQYFAAGAREVGIENEKLADIFKDVSDKMGDFLETGGGPMADFFENIAPAIGVTADEFEHLSGPEILQKYYNSLEEANLSQEKMVFYLEAIASDASWLQPKLENLGAGFKEAGERAKETGLIMDDFTKNSLKNAGTAIDEFKLKMTIAAGETLMGFQIMGDAAKDTDFLSGVKGMGELMLGIAMGNSAAIKGGADEIEGFFLGMDKNAQDAYNTINGETKDFEINFSDISNNVENKWIDTTTSITEASRKSAKESAEAYAKWAAVYDKIVDERIKRAANEMTAQEELNSVIERRIALEEEILTFKPGIDPFSAEQYEKQLELEKLITKEQKLQVEAQAEKEEARRLAIEAITKELELEMELALASGDQDRIAAAREELDIHNQMVALMEHQNMSSEEALDIINRQIAKEQEMIDMQRDLFDAQIAGDDIAIRAAEQKIALEEKALQIMEDFKVSYAEALVMAEDWLTMMAGADLDNSGFITEFEQREYDRIQEERQFVLDEALAAEEREQRERGGNIPNVSEERKDTGSVWERAQDAAEERLRRRENDRINRERDPEERQKLIDQVEKDRQERQLERDKLAFEERMLREKDDAEKRRLEDLEKKGIFEKDGQLFDKDGNPVDPNGNPLPAPKKPQTLDNVIEKMDEMHKTIKSIDKSLKCEP